MNIHEYQAKELLAKFGVPVPAGFAAMSVEEAVKAAEQLPGPLWVVKAQIHAGGRGKAGGVKFCKTTDDVKAAAELAWETRIYNMGQVCNGNKRMIVMDDIYDEFVDELVKLAEQAKPGTPEEAGENGIYSPLSSRDAAERLDEQVSRAVKEGATLRAGGGLGDNAYYAPAVITDLGKDNSVYSEELFGPIALVFKVSSDEEALELANDTQYGLGGAVFSQDTERARAIARQINSGMANVNTPAGEGEEIPFGGVKRSGFGRELGPLGMDEFVNKQLYFEED